MLSPKNFTLLIAIAVGWFSAGAMAGTPCPEREVLYPCYCTDVPLTKRQSFTLVSCAYVQRTSSLESIFTGLRYMTIDRFIIIDSFWEAGDQHSVLPQNWISLLKIRDLQIIDSSVSPTFACDITIGCPNPYLTRLTIRNSSLAENINPLCEMENGVSFYWTSCLSKVQHFSFSRNTLVSFEKNVFPNMMNELLTLNLSHNLISSVGPSAFTNLPKMTALDLSNNRIKAIDQGIFGRKPNSLANLDVSWNLISKLSPDIFKSTPVLVTFSAQSNKLTRLPEEDWKNISIQIRKIDLQGNLIECDCHLVWMNCTLKANVKVLGTCASGYASLNLHTVSRHMSERCDEKGVLQKRVNGTKGNACEGWWKVKKEKKSDVDNWSETFANANHGIIQLPVQIARRNRPRKQQP